MTRISQRKNVKQTREKGLRKETQTKKIGFLSESDRDKEIV